MTGKTGPWRTTIERERDRDQIAAWYLKSKTQAWIAAELSATFYPNHKPITQQQVSSDISAIIDNWRAQAIHDIDALKQIELEKINRLEEEYWLAYEKSKATKSIKTAEKRGNDQNSTTKSSVRQEDRDGNPLYLAGVQWCIEQRCKILGVFAPIKSENTGPIKLVIEYGANRGQTTPTE